MAKLTHFPGWPTGAQRYLVEPEGRGTSGILLIGDYPGEWEEYDGFPFRPQAEAGSLLERALYKAGLSRDVLTVTDIVRYRPFGDFLAPGVEMDAIHSCRPFLDALVERVQPRVILALGNIPFRELTGLGGPKQTVEACRGFICPGVQYSGIPVIGTYHPRYLRRGSKERQKDPDSGKGKVVAPGGGTVGMTLLGTLIRDIQLAHSVAQRGCPKLVLRNHQYHATLEDWKNALLALQQQPELPIFYDFETKDSFEVDDESELPQLRRNVTQAQICFANTVVVSDWFPELLPILRQILELPNPKGDWNGRGFDRPILRDMQIRCDQGEWHDLMDLWHHIQPDLPRALQYATSFVCPEVGPWKHLSKVDAHYYGALDVDMPARLFGWLRTYGKGQRHPVSGISLWDGYDLQVRRLAPCLDAMTARGIPVDNAQREALGQTFDATLAQLDGEMQALVPTELCNVEPKEGFKRTSKLPICCLEAAGQSSIFQSTPIASTVTGEDGTTYTCREFKDSKAPGGKTWRWAKVLPFTPNGKDQVLRYIKWKHSENPKYVVPLDYKTGKETTEEAGLSRLARITGDPLLPLILQSRELNKAKSTYIDGWAPGPDGRVHPQFTFKPATGQLSSHSPNAQNFPQHAQIARKMRQMIQARPGYTLLKFDYKSFHVLTTGFEAQDATYMRMARLDMHSYFALCGLLKLEAPEKVIELPDEELMAKLQWYRKSATTYSQFGNLTFGQIRDQKAKRAILGIGFGQGPRSLFMLNPESFANTNDAAQTIYALNRLFPKPEQWRTTVKFEADVYTFLLTRHGFVRRFWDVFNRRIVASNYQPKIGQSLVKDSQGRTWLCSPGDDAEASVAFRPANNAFGMIREKMVHIQESGLANNFGLILNLHDDLTFECPQQVANVALHEIKSILEEPSTVLVDPQVAPTGLWCEVEASIGQNWDNYSSSNPGGMRKAQV